MLQTLAILIIFLSCLFSAFLLTVPSKNRIGNYILATYLIIRAIDTSSIFYNTYIEVTPILDMIRYDIGAYFDAPLLYLFALSIIYSDFKLKLGMILHAIPFFVAQLFLLPRFYIPFFNGLEADVYNTEGFVRFYIAVIQKLGYIVVIFFLLQKYKQILLQNYSVIDKTNHSWLNWMNYVTLILLIAALTKNIYKWGEDSSYLWIFKFIVLLIMLYFTCWLVFKALFAPKIFTGISSKLQLVSSKGYHQEKNNEDASKINVLKVFMEEKKPFLNSELTINILADQLDMAVNELSELINQKLKKNFYEFITDYRIEEAESIFKNPNNSQLTVLEVMYDVGYNSKSSFNTSFKKKTGMTPTQYKSQFKG
ncbi:AraC family transcriptional regulator [uncultured Psychroserpens sp.]|uniref:helix-turn-helix domain-containing protein n=1 Tax=uncultured Psychroserpens sp. TaxID=255436 RepID=UPI00261FACEA|nr:AraC family transcriptional regulator [uncultured Psychroserpens sp.]